MYRLPKGYIFFVCCVVLVTYLVLHLSTRIHFPRVPDIAGPGTFIRNLNVTHKSKNDSKPWVIVFWSTVFGVQQNIHQVWKKGECPVACEVTSDRSRAAEARGFIVHARDGHMSPPHHTAAWILLTQENPVYTPVLRNPKFMSRFNLLRSYRLDSDFPNPVYSMPELTAPLPFEEKTGIVMPAFSNCEPVRTAYLKQLMQFVQVDSYGACHRNKYDLVNRYGSANGKDFKELKTELARKYKFLLVFFNQDCDYFVDDQLTHALNAGSVPVVISMNSCPAICDTPS